MKLDFTQPDNSAPLKITGTADIYAAEALRGALAQSLQQSPVLKIDLSAVDHCDVVALQLLCSARKSAAAGDKQFALIKVSAAVLKAANALGLALAELSTSEPA